MGECRVSGCGRGIYTGDLCEMHYRRRLRTGSTAGCKLAGDSCSVKGCDLPVDARDLCHGHYQRLVRGKDFD